MTVVALAEIADQVRGVSYGKTDVVDRPTEGFLPVLRANNITDDGLSFDGLVYVRAEKVSAKQQVRSGDIVIAASSGSISVVGKAAQADDDLGMGFGAFCKVVRPSPKVHARYIGHFFKTQDYRRRMSALAAGANINNLKNEHIDELEIPLPPLDEQKRIAAILDQADQLRRKRQRAIDRLNQLGQAIFHEMFGDPAINPKGFDALPLGDAVEFIGGSQPAKSHFLYEDGPDRVRFVQIRDFRTDKYPTWVPKALAKRPFEEEDVMIGRYGPPVFQIFRGLSGTYNVALMKAKPKLHLTSDFVFYLLQEPKLHSFVVANSERTAGQSGVNLSLLEKYPAYAPPAGLLREFSDRIADVDNQARAYREPSMAAERLFASLQHRAFRGEL